MIRLCACFGVGLEVIELCGFALSDKALRRAAMDYAASAEVVRYVSWDAFCAAPRPGRLILLTTAGDAEHWNFAFRPDDALMVGRETAGVPESVAAVADARLRIPMPGGGRSLNVAVAAAVGLAEALRQTRPPGTTINPWPAPAS